MAAQAFQIGSQGSDPQQIATQSDVHSFLSTSMTSGPPKVHEEQPPSDVPAPTSSSPRGTRILKGTGPALDPHASHRQRPDVTYNLKELSHKTRTPSQSLSGTTQHLPEQIDLTEDSCAATDLGEQKFMAAVIGNAQQTSDEGHPAKRRRVDGDFNSPKSLGEGLVWDATSIREGYVPPANNVNQELIAYVWPILLHGGVSNPGELLSLVFFKNFTCLQRKRDLEWNPRSTCNGWAFRTKIDVVALLVQLTGDHSSRCCTKCNPDIGLFKGCIVTTSKLLAQSYYGCANCLYHGRQTFCSFKGGNRQKGMHISVHEQSVSSGTVASVVQEEEASNSTTPNAQIEQRLWSDATGIWNETSTTPKDVKQWDPSVIAAGGHDETSRDSSEILSMEPWERAPGRVRSQVSTNPESKGFLSPMQGAKLTTCLDIAFSKPYLASGAEIQVCREASFRVEIIRSGHTYKVEAENNVVRICSVASAGKLSVKMDGEKPLVIGPHGMFTVRPGSACLVDSEIYDDVALHITSVKTG